MSADDGKNLLVARQRALAQIHRDLDPAVSGSSIVGAHLDDAASRLERTEIEVAVLGEVKRGKSTLVNALAGDEVSTTRITPETAVPVRVVNGVVGSTATRSDGSTDHYDNPLDAARSASQRSRKQGEAASDVVLVTQGVTVDWLPEGATLVDTPGLADPSLIEDYADAALAQLAAASAVILVIVSPPGIAREEVELLNAMIDAATEKIFIVCNFHADQWANPAERDEVAAYVASVASRGTDGRIDFDDHRVFQVNAKAGWEAVTAGDREGFEDSGVARLRNALMVHLRDGAMRRRLAVVRHRLDEAAALLAADIDERIAVLRDPGLLDQRRNAHEEALVSGARRVDELNERIATVSNELQDRTRVALGAPFTTALSDVSKIQRDADLDLARERLRLQLDAALRRTTDDYRATMRDLDALIRNRYLELFAHDLETALPPPLDPATFEDAGLSEFVAPGPDRGTTAANVAGGAALTAAAGTVVGGALAGGVGIALIASGPVGWLIGAGVGALLGAGIGAAGGLAASAGRISDEGRAAIRGQLIHARDTTLDTSAQRVRSDGRQLTERLSALHRSVVDRQRARHQQLAKDSKNEVAAEIQRLEALRHRLDLELQ